MKTSTLLLAALAGVSSICQAQELTVPEGFENSYTGNTTLLWRSTAFRYQCVYDAQHFLNQGITYPIEISRLRFRPLNGTVDAGGQVYTNVTVELSTSMFDSANMVTDFALNTGTDATVCWQQDVTLLPVTGTTPNDHHIDLVLTTPFVYDPNAGPLLVDVTAPTAPTATVPNMAASNDPALHFARRNSSATPTAATGGLSGFAAAMKIDYMPLPGTALKENYGQGCYSRPRMAYELIDGGTNPVDLVGTQWDMIYNGSPQGGTYLIIPGSTPYTTPGAGAVDLVQGAFTSSSSASWDDASVVLSPSGLASGFPYPSVGSQTTTEITVNSNGKVYLGNTVDASFAANGANYGSLDPFSGATGAGLPVLAPFNVDLDPTTGGSIWYEDLGPGAGVRITWDNILNWQDPAYTPLAGANSFQMTMLPTGQVSFAYGASLATDGSAANAAIVGYSPGGGAPTTDSLDWSSLVAYITGDGTIPVVLDADVRPVLGTTVNLTTSDVPANAVGVATILSFSGVPGGADLGVIGMPGCDAYLNLPASIAFSLGGSPSSTFGFAIPSAPIYSGIEVFAQGLVIVPGVNSFNGQTTNGVKLTLGSQ